jgi:iron(III) transport system ATP-binding protein
MTGTAITIDGLSKIYVDRDGASVAALDGVSLEVPEGEFVVLLGPSGCGKTTLLRCLAGLETPTEGTITIGSGTSSSLGGRSSGAPPVGMVFQSYALWPHMTVEQNIAYPLKCIKGEGKLSREAITARTAELITTMRLDNLAKRRPSELSGGQQQRVALARAVAPGNRVVLFDEPLSNIDAKVRELLREELRSMQQRLGFTAVYVTHDQTEALDLADRIVLMREGRVVQMGTSEEIYRSPDSSYVADFVGSSNVLAVKSVLDPGTGLLDTALGELHSSRPWPSTDARVLAVSSRSHAWSVSNTKPSGAANAWKARVLAHSYLGWFHQYIVDVAGTTLRIWQLDDEGKHTPAVVGSDVWVAIAPADCHVVRND